MAGSYSHCRDDDGSFRFKLIENMGDAHEACEEMFFMIGYLAGGDGAKISDAEAAYYASVNPRYDRAKTPPRDYAREGRKTALTSSPPVYALDAAARRGDVIQVGFEDRTKPIERRLRMLKWGGATPMRFIAGEPIQELARVMFDAEGRVWNAT